MKKIILFVLFTLTIGGIFLYEYKDRGLFQERDIGRDKETRDNIPQDKDTCEAKGGKWGRFGLLPKEGCNLPTTDAGKTCMNQDECEGACLADLSQEDLDRITKQNSVIETKGYCSPWLITFGCSARVENSKVNGLLCVD